MALIQMQFLCYIRGHLLTVAGKHHRAPHTEGFQLCNGRRTLLLHLIIDNDVTGILAIHRHVDDGAHQMAVVPLRTRRFHHLGITHTNELATHTGTDALSSNLLNISYFATIYCLIGERVTQRRAHRMGRKMLHMCGQMQQLPFVE